MVILTLTQKLNQALGPFLLRQGINARYAAAFGNLLRDNPTADALCLLPFSQKLIELETYDAMRGLTCSDERIRILDSYLRPALVPNGTWGDIRKWQFHQRLLKWLRSQFLIAKHGPTLYTLPEVIRRSTQLSRDIDSTETFTVPTTKSLVGALGLTHWTHDKDTVAARSTMKYIVEQKLSGELITYRGGAICFAHVEELEHNVGHLSLEEILEVAGCHVAQCAPFNALCEEANVFQFWTREYIRCLAQYLQNRIKGDTVIIDIGAGDGLLAELLRQTFQDRKDNSMGSKDLKIPEIIATDDSSWRIPVRAPVEPWSVEDTMKRFKDDPRDIIVICSWMPLHQDWTHLFRTNNVKEYILIGECDDGQCGDLWETWGNHEFLQLEERSEPPKTEPYEVDGYRRLEISELIPYQLSRFDCRTSKAGRTWSFRRNGSSRTDLQMVY